jgi:hypothetical protein
MLQMSAQTRASAVVITSKVSAVRSRVGVLKAVNVVGVRKMFWNTAVGRSAVQSSSVTKC